ncbi:hypothetical protein DS884_11225 [Tenacibaculum sp. E3R01]|nr:hypothetical protein DS884_11225 [Tenacibaculum sp. E3R01]
MLKKEVMSKQSFYFFKLNALIKSLLLVLILSSYYSCFKQYKKEQKTNNNDYKNVKINTSKSPHYKKDEKMRVLKKFYKNGQLKSEGAFINNKKEGLHKEWSNNGTLVLEGYYKNGLANGLMKWYHEKGYLAGVGLMKNGLRHGIWKVYAIEDGKLTAKVQFKEGKQKEVLKTY